MISIIKRWFYALLRSFWGLLKDIFSGAVEMILAQLKDITIHTVEELEKTDLTSEQKRKEAFERISDYAKNKKIDAQASLINLAIELAVQYIKKKLGG